MSCGEGLPKDDGDEKEGASRRRLEEGRGYFLKCTLTTGSVTKCDAGSRVLPFLARAIFVPVQHGYLLTSFLHV